MNVYDFDKTIYAHDSTVDFFKFLMKRQPAALVRNVPGFLTGGLGYVLRLHSKTQMKEKFYRSFRYVKNIDEEVKEFWDQHQQYIYRWYLDQQKPDDMIISASPYFLLKEITERLGITQLLASEVDKNTGEYSGENCWGKEKVNRLRKVIENPHIEEFYSDSFSDQPLADLADKAYMIIQDEPTDWPRRK